MRERDTPWVIAHRGYSSKAPENTKPAFIKALESEVDGIETDIQLTKDGVPVLFHDRTLKQKLGLRKRIHHFTWSELSQMDFGSWFDARFGGEPLLRLDQAMASWGKKTIWMLEIKVKRGRGARWRDRRTAKLVCKIIKTLDLYEHVMILCFDYQVLRAVNALDHRIRCVLNARRLPARHVIERPSRDFLFGFGIQHEKVTQAFVNDQHARGKKVFVFTANDEASVAHVLECGVDGIISDRLTWLWDRLHGKLT